eukprot:CAMPEP_0173169036 /NCGR_PEP_ID=MMETSP1141-20130122/480_1 /TAXON_ID=483371 /ORGANISM="non described non described, Strain CCMP2298" /LENGTH=100 /DNA_ID=CAMNT_0014090817 /DNA_START=605 /DNA_END=907 /DNA_ORIENTATION=-
MLSALRGMSSCPHWRVRSPVSLCTRSSTSTPPTECTSRTSEALSALSAPISELRVNLGSRMSTGMPRETSSVMLKPVEWLSRKRFAAAIQRTQRTVLTAL